MTMDTNAIRFSIPHPCELAVNRLAEKVKEAGFTILRTFDMHFSQSAQVACPCPVHGYDQCNCQIVVLLIYVESRQPVTLVAHGDDDETIFSIVDTPQQRPDTNTETLLRNLFTYLEMEAGTKQIVDKK